MDTAELAILEHLSKNHLVRTKDMFSVLLERHFKDVDITEALRALERTGHVTRLKPFGDENLALTKAGLREAANRRF
ncbi:MAG: hypothetical protein HY366_00390 [Candidatus Aenigmarchaeota archaeon]|nr:hypothetical protein [Candidatus Aenigmarchaeota archaeon]